MNARSQFISDCDQNQDNTVTMELVVEEEQQEDNLMADCPDNDLRSGLMRLLNRSDNNMSEQIKHDISKCLQVTIDCQPSGFQQNQFCSPAQTKYSCYVNDVLKVTIVLNKSFQANMEAFRASEDRSISRHYCSLFLEKCSAQLRSFTDASASNFENSILEANVEISQLGKTVANERYTTFHVPRPTQKRGKAKKESKSSNSVSKKIGFIQIVHVETRKVLARSSNIWIRSKSREEMEVKKKRCASTSKNSKKVKKQKQETPPKPDDNVSCSMDDEDEGQPTAEEQKCLSAKVSTATASNNYFFPSENTNFFQSSPNLLWPDLGKNPCDNLMDMSFFPTTNYPLSTINNCCNWVSAPSTTFFDCTNTTPNLPTNLIENKENLAPSGNNNTRRHKRKNSNLTPTDLNFDDENKIFSVDFSELSPQSEGTNEEFSPLTDTPKLTSEEHHSIDIWGLEESPLSANNQQADFFEFDFNEMSEN